MALSVKLVTALLIASWAISMPLTSADEDENGQEEQDEDEDEALLEEILGASLVYPQEKGELQLTLAPSFRNQDTGNQIVLGTVVEIGFTDALQAELEWDAIVVDQPDEGDGDAKSGTMEIEILYAFMNPGGAPWSTALSAGLQFPTSEAEEGAAQVDLELAGIAALDLPIKLGQIFAHGGLELDLEEIGEVEPFINLGAFIKLPLVTPTAVLGLDEDGVSVTPGLAFSPGEKWEINLGATIGLTGDTDPYAIAGLISYETPLFD